MIHRFGDEPISDDERFTAIHGSMRSDVEQQFPLVQLHDPFSHDTMMARQIAGECIAIVGALVDVYVRTDNSDIDRTWMIDADPLYWDKEKIKAFFMPQPLQQTLQKWGSDNDNKVELLFDHRSVYERWSLRARTGGLLRHGDVVVIPFNDANLKEGPYRILNATPDGNYRYNWLYLKCTCELLTADITVRPTQDMPTEVPEEDTGYVEGY